MASAVLCSRIEPITILLRIVQLIRLANKTTAVNQKLDSSEFARTLVKPAPTGSTQNTGENTRASSQLIIGRMSDDTKLLRFTSLR